MASLRTLVAATAVAGLTFAFAPAPPSTDTAPQLLTAADVGLDFAPRLVTVDTATLADRNVVASSGLDVTEHAGHDFVEVVLHSADDLDLLESLGYDYDVRIPDLIARESERIAADRAFTERVGISDLPSGRTTYRVLDDFAAEIDELVEGNPEIAKRISLGTSLEGRDLTGIEIGADVQAPEDGRPVFLMFGAHHAREWPSATLPMEFAIDLVTSYGEDARITDLLDRSRVVIVPVSNPDGYDASRTTGDLVDLREVDGGGTASILATPGNAYKRKNCRYVDGQTQPAGTCVAISSPGGFGIGIDLNRNYGALWGGPGADDATPGPEEDGSTGLGTASATYHGPAPFSEPETQAIRDFISSRQVTTVITNHTFSNLILRPVGVQPNTIHPDGFPVGFAPDECFATGAGDNGMQALGERMAAQTGYSNQFGWELYDTTGTTEDYSYNATGGYGYTFEIGPNEFHPPFEQVVAEYNGDTDAAKGVTADNVGDLTTAAGDDCGEAAHDHDTVGGGNREAFLLALENAVDTATHAVISGSAPAGATISVERSGTFPLWDGTPFADTVATSMVAPGGAFEYHVNPSTRPFVRSRNYSDLDQIDEVSATGLTTPAAPTDTPFEVGPGVDAIVLELSSAALSIDDYELVLLAPDGSQLASSTNFGSAERVSYQPAEGVEPGEYIARVENYAAASEWTLSGGTFEAVEAQTPRQFETWTLTCTVDGDVRGQAPVLIERGETVDVGAVCG